MFYVFLLYALFASVFIVSKAGLTVTQPLFFVGSRMFLAGFLLITYQLFNKKESFSFNKKTWGRIILLSLFCVYFTNAFEFWGLQYLTSSKTCFIYSLSPFLSALVSYLFLSEKLTQKQWIGLAIGFCGFIPVLVTQTAAEESAGQFFLFSWAELSVILGVICSVYGWIVLKQLVSEHQLSPLTANGFGMLIGGVLALIHSYAVETWDPFPFSDTTVYIECSILLIVISNLICYNLYGSLLKSYSATFISFAGLTTPLFAALFGWIILGEVVTWPFYLSFMIVVAGLFIYDQEELRALIKQ